MTKTLVAPSATADQAPPDVAGTRPTHRIVLVDPRVDRRAIMNYFVDQCPSLSVVGLAANLDEAASQIRSEQADVALVEIQMPLVEGLATIAGLRDQFPELRIVVCSFLDDAATRDAARSQGADGYLAKPPRAADLLVLLVGPPPTPPDSDSEQT